MLTQKWQVQKTDMTAGIWWEDAGGLLKGNATWRHTSETRWHHKEPVGENEWQHPLCNPSMPLTPRCSSASFLTLNVMMLGFSFCLWSVFHPFQRSQRTLVPPAIRTFSFCRQCWASLEVTPYGFFGLNWVQSQEARLDHQTPIQTVLQSL